MNSISLLKEESITKTISAIITDATNTISELLCNSLHVGHDTLFRSSSTDSSIYALIFDIRLFFKFGSPARAPGFEPRSTVLETAILPLNYARNVVCFLCQERHSENGTPFLAYYLSFLFNNFNNLACSNCSSSFSYSKTKSFVDCHRHN